MTIYPVGYQKTHRINYVRIGTAFMYKSYPAISTKQSGQPQLNLPSRQPIRINEQANDTQKTPNPLL